MFTTWLGVASTRTVCAIPCVGQTRAAHRRTTAFSVLRKINWDTNDRLLSMAWPSQDLREIPPKSHTPSRRVTATPDAGGFHVMKLRFRLAFVGCTLLYNLLSPRSAIPRYATGAFFMLLKVFDDRVALGRAAAEQAAAAI